MIVVTTADTVWIKSPNSWFPPQKGNAVSAAGDQQFGLFAFCTPCSSPGQTAQCRRRNRVKAGRGLMHTAIEMSDQQWEQEPSIGPIVRRNPANGISVKHSLHVRMRTLDWKAKEYRTVIDGRPTGQGIAKPLSSRGLGEYSPAFLKAHSGASFYG